MALTIKKADSIESLVRGLAVIRQFGADTAELSIQDVAERLNLSRAAARRFMITLESLGYLERTARAFRLTPEVLRLGYSYYASSDLPSIVDPFLRQLVQRFEEPCGLCVLHRDEVVYLGGRAGNKPYPATVDPGTFLPAYPTATGRVLLAGLSARALADYFKRVELVPFTPFTTTNKSELKLAVAKARHSGYCLLQNELAYGSGGMAVPILNGSGSVCAALYIGLQYGRSARAMASRYLPELQVAARKVHEILRQTTGLPV
jgi:IclR family pca regulon transcriptional regulator